MKNIKLALVGLFVFTFLTIPYLGVKLNSIEDYDLPLLVKQVSPSVVHIEGNDDYGEWSGSGVVISSDGLLLTAGHIVENAIDIKVTIGDKEYEAIDFYKSDVTDIGIVLIDANDLSYSRLGDSEKLRQGQGVFLVGSPYGLYNSVTLGIISGLEREVPFFGEKLILQSDAASNPGNSGGPLFNMDGEVVGVLVGGIMGADGIAFCIPVNVCKAVLSVYVEGIELKGIK